MKIVHNVAVCVAALCLAGTAMAAGTCKQIARPESCHVIHANAGLIVMGVVVSPEIGHFNYWDESDDALKPWHDDFLKGDAVVGDMNVCILRSEYYKYEQLMRTYACVADITNAVKISADESAESICKRANWNCPKK